ncbi:alanine--tRNA ligase [Enterobacterales bacterium endosymbiont of Anomoneura mori]|uniref:alanine--tRNA ligase n=1 Tax=Enterobacterales bacterium endosymbiont of Anomoneura mori TaxID=3132096 RepID=UPI00399CC327
MIKSINNIRKTFLNFFESKNHKILKGSKLIIENDKTLLFTNSGMNQFKNIFLGFEKSNFTRVATAQHCIRAGGKNNDLENVGYTNRHHTFFEMLGNFSFNDYFKLDAINFAWELLTSEKWFNLPKKKLLVTVYISDNETYNIWKKNIKIPENKIIIIGDEKGIKYKSDNFWQTGNNYPCGPCTEIFYDKGNTKNINILNNNKINDRYIEIWNIVFLQFLKQNNNIIPLSNLSIDTGMGLERITSIIQKVNSNYEIDLFKKIINNIYNKFNIKYNNKKSVYVISDHIRSSAYLILNGVIPSNESHGYVLRKIIRRAIFHGNKLGIKKPFLYKILDILINAMENEAKYLKKKKKIIKNIIKKEEIKFLYTLNKGLKLLNLELLKLNNNILNGDIVFRLYDTYGFPKKLTEEICIKKGYKIDKKKYYYLMNKQRIKSLKSNKFFFNNDKIINFNYNNKFVGYKKYQNKSKIIAIFKNFNLIKELFYNEEAIIILNSTPFYGELEGQIGDKGLLISKNTIFLIYDTKVYNKTILHVGKIIKGKLKINQFVKAIVNKKIRINISKNHTAIHILYKILKNELNNNIKQKNSYICEKYLLFDFSCSLKINEKKINLIENIINKKIMENLLIKTKILNLNNYKNNNYLYNKNINNRLIKINNFSKEFCKGTHVKYTGEIGMFHIKSYNKLTNGLFRIKAVTGKYALKILQFKNNLIKKISNILNNKKNIDKILINIYNNKKNIEKKYKKQKIYILNNCFFFIFNKIKLFNNIKIIINNIKNIKLNLLINTLYNIKKKIGTSIFITILKKKNKNFLIIEITLDLIKYINLKSIIKKIIKNFKCIGKISKVSLKAEIKNIDFFYKYLNNIKKYLNI